MSMDDSAKMEDVLLSFLYSAYFEGEGEGNLKDYLSTIRMDSNLFWKIADKLTNDGYIKPFACGGFYLITALGIIETECRGLVPEEKKAANERARTKVLALLMDVYDKGDSYSDAQYENILKETNIDRKVFLDNIQVLDDLGYTESTTMGSFKITYHGIEAVKDWKCRTQLASEFERLKALNPQQRGIAFQGLFGRLVESNDWKMEKSVRTANEEMDIVLSREREFYLLECKWEKDKTGAEVVRELFGKLSNRIDTRGIIVSMSGFTSGAIDQAIDYASQRIILLFGPIDVNSLVNGQEIFEVLLNRKYRLLITRKQIICD